MTCISSIRGRKESPPAPNKQDGYSLFELLVVIIIIAFATMLTPAMTTDDTGAVIDRYTYSPYGESGPEGDTGFAYRFTGQKLDADTGLYYYKARFYDPETGRFMQTDPIGYEDQMNLYAYVGNDPINWFDPDGRQPDSVMDRRSQAGLECARYQGCRDFAAQAGGAVAIIVGGALVVIPDPGFADVAGVYFIARGGQVIRVTRAGNRARTAIFRQVQNKTRGLRNQLDSRTLESARRELRGEITGTSQRTGRAYDHVRKISTGSARSSKTARQIGEIET